MIRVGVADLKSSLSAYLDRVKSGEMVMVTEHGRPVARLVPIHMGALDDEARVADLERRGLIIRGQDPLGDDFWDLPWAEDPEGKSLAALLDEREDER